MVGPSNCSVTDGTHFFDQDKTLPFSMHIYRNNNFLGIFKNDMACLNIRISFNFSQSFEKDTWIYDLKLYFRNCDI